MGTPVMIMGKSGNGKSTSMRTLNAETTFLVKPLNKPLPFRSADWKKFDAQTMTGSWTVTDQASQIIAFIEHSKSAGKKVIVIDDAQYIMANEFMYRAYEKGFEKFTQIGEHFWAIVKASAELADDDVRIYFLMHTEENELGGAKAKTIGKLLDEKITLEGMFTIVMKATRNPDGDYIFRTQSDGNDTCKSPMGMFEAEEIPNDLDAVDTVICNYYGYTK